MTKNEILREFVRAEINFDSGKANYIDDTFTPVLDLVYKLVNKTNDRHSVSNPLPTKEEVIAEGDKQIKDWLMGNSFEERTAYRIGFRRSFEYVLRFIK